MMRKYKTANLTRRFVSPITVGFLFLLGCIQLWSLISSVKPLISTGILAEVLSSNESENPDVIPEVILTTPEHQVNQETIVTETPERITIPRINLDLEIRSVPLVNGTWEVYDFVANFAEETSLPNNTTGNTGLYGHDRAHAFANIKKLVSQDAIIVSTKNYTFFYLVESSKQIGPEQVDVFYPTGKPTLTLVTCDGSFSERRYVIQALFKEAKLIVRNEQDI